MSLAFVFPGQGSQSVGMGAELYETFSRARDVFNEIDEALGQKLFQLMKEGPEDQLTLTENAQPAIMAVSLAVARVLEGDFGIPCSAARYVAGHSLGEYSAHAAAGTFSLAETARLLKLRGQAMQRAAPVGVGAMAALIGKADLELAEQACEAGSAAGVVVVANDNNAGQIVISGVKAAVELAIEKAKELGAKGMLLNVSAPFHSPLMEPAAEEMRIALSGTVIHDPCATVVANVTARPIAETSDIAGLLVQQVTGRVRWRESVQWLAGQESENGGGTTTIAELGAGKVLTGMIKRIAPNTNAVALNSAADFEAFAQSLK